MSLSDLVARGVALIGGAAIQMRKLGLQTQTALVRYAAARGLIPGDG